jgi:hypothetical protein|tara:strand:+ start:191 stop:1771 length:1581 start_codon:yes stop_codon:yes gene_type:complete
MAQSLQGNLTKKAHSKVKFTGDQILELNKCMDPKTGPIYFMKKYCMIQHPTKGSMPFEMFDYQTRLVSTYHNNRFSIAMLPRQTGKTTCAAAYLVWYAMFVPDSQILIAAHKFTGAQDIMNRVRFTYESLPDFIRAGAYSYNRNTLEFDNGSRIKATTTTENTGRGMSLSVIYCDEFAFVQPPSKASEFWTSLAPTLATGGKCIITSTPNSDEDQFALIWKEANKKLDEYGNELPIGRNGFAAFQASWREHPDRTEKWAKEERARIGEERFRREHDCEFLIYDETLIKATKLVDLEGVEPTERHGHVRWYKKVQKGKAYIFALDPSLGTGGDYAAIQLYELPTMTQVAEWQHNNTPIQGQVRILKTMIEEVADSLKEQGIVQPEIYYSIENNTIGEAGLVAISDIGEENISGQLLSEAVKKGHVRRFRKGYNTTHNSKMSACAKFKQMVENDSMVIKSKNLVSELKNFVASGNSFKAKPGEHDDLVMSTLLAVRMASTISAWDQKLFERLRDSEEELIMPMPIIMS